ncbi:hypothetical protein RRF57_011387 [Xylaria bambusicola]|uniref:Uncharacterized protein n=1 Tax=Xylaria bambusicola TaxID=326684 RepID=A0AAN7Z3L9_9PEZI
MTVDLIRQPKGPNHNETFPKSASTRNKGNSDGIRRGIATTPPPAEGSRKRNRDGSWQEVTPIPSLEGKRIRYGSNHGSTILKEKSLHPPKRVKTKRVKRRNSKGTRHEVKPAQPHTMEPHHRAIVNTIHKRLGENIDMQIELQILIMRAKESPAWWVYGAAGHGRGIPQADLSRAVEAVKMVAKDMKLQNTFARKRDIYLARTAKTGVGYLETLGEAIVQIRESLSALDKAQKQKDMKEYHAAFTNYMYHGRGYILGTYKGKADGKKSRLSQVWNAEDVTVAERIEAGGDVSWEERAEYWLATEGATVEALGW